MSILNNIKKGLKIFKWFSNAIIDPNKYPYIIYGLVIVCILTLINIYNIQQSAYQSSLLTIQLKNTNLKITNYQIEIQKILCKQKEQIYSNIKEIIVVDDTINKQTNNSKDFSISFPNIVVVTVNKKLDEYAIFKHENQLIIHIIKYCNNH